MRCSSAHRQPWHGWSTPCICAKLYGGVQALERWVQLQRRGCGVDDYTVASSGGVESSVVGDNPFLPLNVLNDTDGCSDPHRHGNGALHQCPLEEVCSATFTYCWRVCKFNTIDGLYVHDAFKRPFLKNIRSDRLDQPAYNTIEGNTYCKCGMFIDASQKDIDGWGSKADNNVEVETC